MACRGSEVASVFVDDAGHEAVFPGGGDNRSPALPLARWPHPPARCFLTPRPGSFPLKTYRHLGQVAVFIESMISI